MASTRRVAAVEATAAREPRPTAGVDRAVTGHQRTCGLSSLPELEVAGRVKIGILGTGNVAEALGTGWTRAGHQVTFGSRTPASERAGQLASRLGCSVVSPGELAGNEVLVLAIPWQAAIDLLAQVPQSQRSGSIVVDCINPLKADFSGLDLGFEVSAAERIQQAFPETRVVKAFNTVSAATMADPDYGGQPATLFFCGDDAAAAGTVQQLADDLGFEAVNAGPLSNARHLEPLAMLYIHLAMNGWGGNCAFKILKREKKS